MRREVTLCTIDSDCRHTAALSLLIVTGVLAADEKKHVGAVCDTGTRKKFGAAMRPPRSLAPPGRLEGVSQGKSSDIGVKITRGDYG